MEDASAYASLVMSNGAIYPCTPSGFTLTCTTAGIRGSGHNVAMYLSVGGQLSVIPAPRLLNYTAPNITSIEPNYGPLGVSITITIRGTDFDLPASITVGSTIVATISSTTDTTSLIFVLPAIVTPGATLITITCNQRVGNSVPFYTYVFLAGGMITYAPVRGGTTVLVTGAGFKAGLYTPIINIQSYSPRVTVGSATSVTVAGGSTITMTLPAVTTFSPVSYKVAGRYALEAVLNDRTATTIPIDVYYYNLPTLLSITPQSGPATGNEAYPALGTAMMQCNGHVGHHYRWHGR